MNVAVKVIKTDRLAENLTAAASGKDNNALRRWCVAQITGLSKPDSEDCQADWASFGTELPIDAHYMHSLRCRDKMLCGITAWFQHWQSSAAYSSWFFYCQYLLVLSALRNKSYSALNKLVALSSGSL